MLGGVVTSSGSAAGALLATNNLSDLNSASTAITNLGIGFPTLTVAASNATAHQKAMADFVCTGTNDDLIINAALSSLPAGGGVVALYGTFNITQAILIHSAFAVLDLYNAFISVPGSFAPSAECAIMVGAQHGFTATRSIVGGVATFTNSIGTALTNGDALYMALESTGSLPTGFSANTQYFVVNYTPVSFGNCSFQLALTPGGSPIASASAGTGTLNFADAFATYNSSTNIMTVAGASPPQLSAATPFILFSSAAGDNPTGMSLNVPYFPRPLGSNTYSLWNDAAFTSQVTASTNGNANGFTIMICMQGCQIRGGQFNVAAGAQFGTVGILRTARTALNPIVRDTTWTVDPSMSQPTIVINAIGAKCEDNLIIGGNWGVFFNQGTYSTLARCTITGALGGVKLGASLSPFCGNIIEHNQIQRCNQQAVSILTGATGVVVGENVLSNNCIGATGSANILNAGTGTIIGPNSFSLSGNGEGTIIDTGTSTVITANSLSVLALGGGTMSGAIAMGGQNISGGGTFTATTFVGALTGNASTATSATSATTATNAGNVTGTVAIANGGTGATSASVALTNLGALALAGGTMSGTLALASHTMSLDGSASMKSDGSGNVTLTATSFVFSGPVVLNNPQITLTDAASIATDASKSNIFTVTLGGNRTLANPTNPTDGQRVIWKIRQPASGGPYTLAYGTQFNWGTAAAPTLSTAANAVDLVGGVYDATKSEWMMGFTLGF